MARATGAESVAERDPDIRNDREAPASGGFELLDSKLLPPPPREETVFRSGLIERLQAVGDQRVVVVSAAPGYGKTTALAQWMARSRRRFGWISLDEGDNDPAVLLSYVAAGLDRIERLPSAVFEALASSEASIKGSIVPRLGSAVAGIRRSFVLVLDDFHAVTDSGCLDAIDVLIDHLPDGSQLVLSGQIQPSRRVGSLRAHGQLLEIGPEELRMDVTEAGALLAGTQVQVSDEGLSELVERTEGWPAGLYLAALSIAEGGSSVASFHGDDRLIADYMRDELLFRLPDP